MRLRGAERARITTFLTTPSGKALPDEIQARMLALPDGELQRLGLVASDPAELVELAEMLSQLDARHKARIAAARALTDESLSRMRCIEHAPRAAEWRVDSASWEAIAGIVTILVTRHSLDALVATVERPR